MIQQTPPSTLKREVWQQSSVFFPLLNKRRRYICWVTAAQMNRGNGSLSGWKLWAHKYQRCRTPYSTRGVVLPSTRRVVLPSTRGVVLPSTRGDVLPSTRVVVLPSTRGVLLPSTRGVVLPSTKDVVLPGTRGVISEWKFWVEIITQLIVIITQHKQSQNK